MNRYYLTGVCIDERTIGISKIQDSVNQYGSIIDFKFFSDISISFIIEISENKVKEMHTNLSDVISLSDLKIPPSESNNDCIILLNISFTKGSGNKRNEISDIGD
jgi:hypothetical protein